MDPILPGRLELLLMRVFDGEATDAERAELFAWAEAEPRLARLGELRAALLDALTGQGPVDVVADVMAALDEEAAFAPVGGAIREALSAPVDFTDAIMASVRAPDPDLELSAFSDGELPDGRAVAARLKDDAAARDVLAAWAHVGHQLREATSEPVDAWPAVAAAIDVPADHVPGWEPIGDQIRAALAGERVDVAGAVMARIDPPARRMPKWASLWVPLAGFAAAAALLFAVVPPPPQEVRDLVHDAALTSLRLQDENDAQVEEITGGENVVVQVVQFEENGPTFIMIDEPEGASL
ncbi:MAG: hypothetical protein ACOZNI_04470 [Myxococcota bacterium]